MTSTWLILGSGADAQRDYPIVRSTLPPDAIVATCNAGLRIEPNPGHYWLTDSNAVDLYLAEAREAVRRGVNLITNKMAVRMRRELAPIAGEVLDYPTEMMTEWAPGRLCNCRTGGGMLTQLAVMRGAGAIHMVGMSGYASTRGSLEADYFDGRKGKPVHGDVMRYYGPVMQSLFDQTPGVRWVFHGRPNWPWGGSNVEIIESEVIA